MGVKVKTNVNKIPLMEKSLKALDGKKVNAGVLGGGENAWLAGIHEYGCTIEVTPKMRAYLHTQGLHLKKETTKIVIPERAFLRNGYEEGKNEVVSNAETILGTVIEGGIKTEEFCKMIGLLLSSKIKNYARDLREPANHPFTKERKGSSNPLIDSGGMIEAITYEVEE